MQEQLPPTAWMQEQLSQSIDKDYHKTELYLYFQHRAQIIDFSTRQKLTAHDALGHNSTHIPSIIFLIILRGPLIIAFRKFGVQ